MFVCFAVEIALAMAMFEADCGKYPVSYLNEGFLCFLNVVTWNAKPPD